MALTRLGLCMQEAALQSMTRHVRHRRMQSAYFTKAELACMGGHDALHASAPPPPAPIGTRRSQRHIPAQPTHDMQVCYMPCICCMQPHNILQHGSMHQLIARM